MSIKSARVFIVDDEKNVLSGIRRSLTAISDDWETSYFSDPAKALEAFRQTPADVVVTDMMMPGMTGVELVGAMRKISPETVFLMLTGSSDLQTAADSINEASVYKFLMKPCPPEVLLDGIESGVLAKQSAAGRLEIAGLSKAALDMLSTGVIVVDRDIRVQLMNNSARKIIETRDGLLVNATDNICRTENVRHTAALSEIVRRTLENEDSSEEPGVMSVPRSGERRPFTIAVTPAGTGTDGIQPPAENYACLYICDHDTAQPLSVTAISALFDLTPAESRIAQAIAGGEDLNSIALSQGITVSTARTYLKRVFSKTETGRQAELVRLLLTSPQLFTGHETVE